jgi:glyoxylase-like metal-dependent hydrolase (beta-lactamase superfamily II)
MELRSIEGNTQRLDGGAMFGNCPRALWARWCAPDDHNRIVLACRSLLVREDDGRTLLFEAGIGAFFEPKLRERYGVQEEEHMLLRSLAEVGILPADVGVVVLSHLHFDHAGGLLTAWEHGAAPRLAFPEAHYVVSREGWERAVSPHPRDRASFIPELPGLLQATGRLEIVDGDSSTTLGDGYRFTYSYGHTPGLMLTTIEGPKGPVTFMADLAPGVPWVHLPITMGYDRYPERLIDEKRALLERIRAEDGWMFFTHDAEVAAARVAVDDRGRFCAVDPQPSIHWT